MLQASATFADQVSVQAYLCDLYYLLAAVALFMIVVALGLIDGGLLAGKHLADNMAQKMICGFIGGGCSMIGGYAIWTWQFNEALGVPHPLAQAFSDWWLFGRYMRTFAQNIDPAAAPGAEVSQIFVPFMFSYAAVMGAYVHSIGLGRIKPVVSYVLSACAGGIFMPVLLYLTWGPTGPLTNNGLHDFVGAFSLYMFVGTWGVILAWRLGPRMASTNGFDPNMVGLGVMLIMAAIPIFIVGCGFVVPGTGYFGVSNTTSGMGIVFCNVFAAYTGGAVSGAIIGYRKHKSIYVYLGPITGYVCCTAFADIAAPWECMIIGLAGPWLMKLGRDATTKLNLDDQKIVPAILGTSIFSTLVAGVVGAGLPTGGMAGGIPGYEFQHAHISFGMQCVGVVVTLAISAVSGLVLIFGLEKTVGLRVPRQIEQDGLDEWYWNEWRKSRKMRVSPKQLAGYRPEAVIIKT